MRRREFIAGGVAAAWPLVARAQQAERMRRIGVLTGGLDLPNSGKGYPIMVAELRKLGFIEGQNLVIEHRRHDGGTAKTFAGANELVAAKAEVLVASGPELALQAAAAARPPVPIVVMAVNFDPIARGYVASLSRPGGNITGLFYRLPELAAKQLEILAEAFPDRKQVAVLWDQYSADQFAVAERTAQSMRLSLWPLKLESPPYDWDAAFRTLAQAGAHAVLVLSSPLFGGHREQIAGLAIQHRLPTMFTFDYYVEAGGLISYGVSIEPVWRRAASYVAKILRGAQPAELPLEQITNFELALNLKTAKAIGVALPTSILLRADEVIE
jgi:putative ABC transport system substrate-binding protein